MTLAMRLAERAQKLRSLNRRARSAVLPRFGRSATSSWDKHYHVVLASDTYTRKIIEEVGLGDDFRWVETKTGFYTDGELVSMSNTMEFLKFKPLGLISKFRLGLTILYASRVKRLAAARKDNRRGLAHADIGPQDVRQDVEATSQGKAWRCVQRNLGVIHLGLHTADVLGTAFGHEKRDVRLRSRRLRTRARTLWRGAAR